MNKCVLRNYYMPLNFTESLMGGSPRLGLSDREDRMKGPYSWVLIVINIILGKGNMRKGVLRRTF